MILPTITIINICLFYILLYVAHIIKIPQSILHILNRQYENIINLKNDDDLQLQEL